MIGKDIIGLAAENPKRNKAVANTTAGDAIVAAAKVSLLPLPTVDHRMVEEGRESTQTRRDGVEPQEKRKEQAP